MDCCAWMVPSRPVNPWTISRVFLSTSMLIVSSWDHFSSWAPLPRSQFDYLLRRVQHIRSHREIEPGLQQNLPSEFHVGAFHAYHDRHLNIEVPRRPHHAGGQRIAAQDAAENVNQHGLDVPVREQDAEGVL